MRRYDAIPSERHINWTNGKTHTLKCSSANILARCITAVAWEEGAFTNRVHGWHRTLSIQRILLYLVCMQAAIAATPSKDMQHEVEPSKTRRHAHAHKHGTSTSRHSQLYVLQPRKGNINAAALRAIQDCGFECVKWECKIEVLGLDAATKNAVTS